ncbi:3-isopropylmalate dehydratase small subunit [Pleionea sp. CnH1-48]|uniref:3-isopropylmalate dehydratase small subunit n=1 Tax=Pleionea sp. CnH1-48 TaxID=2954494 RepID=UPI002096E9F1|nr:3-isopropylmalate dehydratase small subunit [Pleionea sp. CnH1-48]MCO7223625.1 3-isopropylmalate dehydratase small subunit [Pleionea sp. CnH1-48]
MEAFKEFCAKAAPLDRANVDTDAIIPKQFLKSIRRSGFGPYLFDEWRYLDQGEPEMDCSQRPLNSDFVLNQDRYQNAQVLLARQNFGCGSSREHAPWALADYGFKTIIAPSYADIFFNNCFKNGILPIVLDEETVDQLFKACVENTGFEVTVLLSEQQLKFSHPLANGQTTLAFDVEPGRKHCLLEGLDDIGLTLQQADKIKQFEAKHREQAPWVFATIAK